MPKEVRLPKHILPERYKIIIKPDLKQLAFSGEETIYLIMKAPAGEITLHAVDLKISDVYIEQAGKKFRAKSIRYDKQKEIVKFRFAETIKSGNAELHLKFRAKLNEKLHGFYKSSYEFGGETKYLAVTQFEATDARRAFPSFDEPAMKAVFDITIIVPKHLAAISNTVPVETIEHQSGIHAVKFAPTPKMSTYLVAFVVGELEMIEGRTKDGVLVRVFTTRGKKHQGKFALDVAIKCLEFFNEYFAIDYPLPILDLIAVPDFEAGAMENWGAVIYRETALLVDPDHSSSAAKQRVAITICHELAHQWFGNLVTMDWWTELWLNEGFATYAEYLATDRIFPEWNLWTQFVAQDLSIALNLDSLANSHPIEVEVRHPDEISEIFDMISYAKGASVIRMLADYLGEKDFRDGLRYYLKKHAYGNATTVDLWRALEHVSGKPVAKVMANWTGKAGYPVVSVKNSKKALLLAQSRFFSSAISRKKNQQKTLWQIPLLIKRKNFAKIEKKLMPKQSLALPALKTGEWLKLNYGQAGVYRTAYDPELLHLLKQPIFEKKLDVTDRWSVVSDAFALAEAGELETSEALQLLEFYQNEDNYNVWREIVASLNQLDNLLHDSSGYEEFRASALKIFQPIAHKVGWKKLPNDSHERILLRSLVLNNAAKYGDSEIIAKAKRLFAAHLEGKHIDADLRSCVYAIVGRESGKKEYQQFLRLYRKEHLHEEKERLELAMTNFRGKALISQTLNFSLSDEVRLQDMAHLLAFIFHNSAAQEMAWQFLKKNWRKILAKLKGQALALSVIVGALSVFKSEAWAGEVEAFFKKNRAPRAERTLQQSLEQIRSNAHWLSRLK